MQFYWSLKKIPELQQRSAKERRQAVWQVGLKPLRHWQLWAGMLATSLVLLWGLQTWAGNILWSETADSSNWGATLLLLGSVAIVVLAYLLIYRPAYVAALRPHVAAVTFDPAGGWWSSWAKSLVIGLVPFLIIVAAMLGMDWTINSFDESPDPRMAAFRSWPQPIPAAGNGAIAAAGLMAAPGTSPFEAGERWIAAVNEAIARNSQEFPELPDQLQYVKYAGKPRADGTPVKPTAYFCDIGAESCWKVLQQERSEVSAWLAANQMLLARYVALRDYPQWQFAILPDHAVAPIPPYHRLLQAQGLLLASAMLTIEQKQVGKGLGMIGDDIRFVRSILAANESLVGKMAASIMLAKDIALLAEAMQQRPADVKPYWAQIDKMLEPLAPSQISLVGAFRLEERWAAAYIAQDPYAPEAGGAQSLYGAWLSHHYKQNASTNMMVEFWEKTIKRMEIRDVNSTPAFAREDSRAAFEFSRWTGFTHNQAGKLVALIAIPEYRDYPNRLFDLNALNNLVRLRLQLLEKNVAAQDVPAFLNASDKSLWNPETGKPFEWDAERRQVYFVPATDVFKKRYPLGSGVAGRVSLLIN